MKEESFDVVILGIEEGECRRGKWLREEEREYVIERPSDFMRLVKGGATEALTEHAEVRARKQPAEHGRSPRDIGAFIAWKIQVCCIRWSQNDLQKTLLDSKG